MTTHYEKIQALGNRMASNLETMGVSASFSDGGLTLADKILQIQRFTDGLLLSADNSVDQSGNTVKLTALLMKTGETVSGATVLLFTDWINQTYSSNTTINQSIGNEWTIDVGNTANIWICANNSTIAGGSAILAISKGSLIVYKNGNQQVVRSHSSSVYSYKDGVVYYGNTSVDISSYGVDVTNLYKTSDVGGVVKVTYGVSLTTDSNGVASYSYTCAGVGKKEFYAKYGSIQSNTYEVMDAKFYDSAILNDPQINNTYYKSNSNYERFSDGTLITATGSSNGYLMIDETGDTKPFNQELCFECDIVTSSSNNNGFFIVGTNNTLIKTASTTTGYHVKLEVKTTGITITIDDGTPSSYSAVSGNYDIRFIVATGQTMKFKNAVLYPI